MLTRGYNICESQSTIKLWIAIHMNVKKMVRRTDSILSNSRNLLIIQVFRK